MYYPFIPIDRMAREANNLIEQHYQKPLAEIPLPIDVAAIAEFTLGYQLHYGLEGHLSSDNVMGLIDFEQKAIWLHGKLDSTQDNAVRGRENFTIGHEIGHHVLHKPLIDAATMQQSLFEKPQQSILCRDAESDIKIKKPPQEIQADMFAAHLLMPEVLVKQEFFRIVRNTPIYHGKRVVPNELAAQPLSVIFATSVQSMLIRLNSFNFPKDSVYTERLIA